MNSMDIATTIIPNPIDFECTLCTDLIPRGEGVQLKNCSHKICKTCLKNQVTSCYEIPTPCPLTCKSYLLDTESRAFLDEAEMGFYNEKVVQISPKSNKNVQCKTADCKYAVKIDGYFQDWTCPVCKAVNCLNCNVVHKKETCEEYELKRNLELEKINKMIQEKKLMRCPNCENLIQKTSGCNLVTCDNCNIDLCWVRQMRRWGPKGPGDQTDGCKCGLDGKRCHPDCKNGCIPHGSPNYFPRTPNYSTENIPYLPTYISEISRYLPENSNNSRCIIS